MFVESLDEAILDVETIECAKSGDTVSVKYRSECVLSEILSLLLRFCAQTAYGSFFRPLRIDDFDFVVFED